MNHFKFIPYSKRLVFRAREFRKESTEAEKMFWKEVFKGKQLSNLKFTRQKPVGDFIVDFYCASLCLAIEVDGEIHDRQRDEERDNILLEKFGVRVVRYKNEEVLNNIEKVQENLIQRIRELTPFPASPISPPDKGDRGG